MAMPPALLNAMKRKQGSAAEDAKDGGKDDAMETAVKGMAKKGSKIPPKKMRGNLPPQFQAAIARRMGK